MNDSLKSFPVKGVVLAAGFGARLQPLTAQTPKPLIPFAGTTPLEIALWQFAQLGIEEVAVNGHYLADAIENFLSERPFDLKIEFSRESEILGTGGAYNPLRGWRQNASLIVLNGDIVSNIDMKRLWRIHDNLDVVATMAVLPTVIEGESPVHCHGSFVKAIGGKAPSATAQRNFACAQILSPRFLDSLPSSGSFDVISKGYAKALDAATKIGCFIHSGALWHDIRTPDFYWRALRQIVIDPRPLKDLWRRKSVPIEHCTSASHGFSFKVRPPAIINRTAAIHPTAHIGPFAVIEAGAKVGSEVRLSNAVVFPGAEIGDDECIDSLVITPSHRVPIQTRNLFKQ